MNRLDRHPAGAFLRPQAGSTPVACRKKTEADQRREDGSAGNISWVSQTRRPKHLGRAIPSRPRDGYARTGLCSRGQLRRLSGNGLKPGGCWRAKSLAVAVRSVALQDVTAERTHRGPACRRLSQRTDALLTRPSRRMPSNPAGVRQRCGPSFLGGLQGLGLHRCL